MTTYIIQAHLHKITNIGPYRKQMVIFMYVLRFTADYFAASPMVDVPSYSYIYVLVHAALLRAVRKIAGPHILSQLLLTVGVQLILAFLKTISDRCMRMLEVYDKHVGLWTGWNSIFIADSTFPLVLSNEKKATWSSETLPTITKCLEGVLITTQNLLMHPIMY